MALDCGIDFISIGSKKVSSGAVIEALKAAKGQPDLNEAITESYSALPPKAATLKSWDKWFRNLYGEKNEKDLNSSDILGPDVTNDARAKKLLDIVNLENYKYRKSGETRYSIGDDARKVFNQAKRKILSRTEGLSPSQIEGLIEALNDVLTKEDLVQKANKTRKDAKKNLGKTLGTNTTIGNHLDRMFAIDPRKIPSEHISQYLDILGEFSKRGQKTLRKSGLIVNDIQELLAALPEDINMPIKKAHKEVKESSRVPIETLQDQVLLKEVTFGALSTPEEREHADFISKLNKKDLDGLTRKQLRKLIVGIDNINAGWFHGDTLEIIEEIQSNFSGRIGSNKGKGMNGTNFTNFMSRTYGKLKGLWRGDTNAFTEIIRSNPTTIVDQLFGNKGKEIYNITFGKLASKYAQFETEAGAITNKLDAAEQVLNKKFKGNDLAKAKFRIKTYLIQREAEANAGEKGVHSAKKWLNSTIDAIKNFEVTFYDEDTARLLKEVRDEGNVDDAEALYKSLSNEERESVKVIDEINEALVPKVLYTTGIVHGTRSKVYAFHTHHNTIKVQDEVDLNTKQRKSQFKSTTKAGTVIERTTGVKPISFDPFYDIDKTGRQMLLDFHMTSTNRVVQKTAIKMIENLKNDPSATPESIQGALALKSTIDEVLDNVFDSNNIGYSRVDQYFNEIKKLGYYATLASVPRAVSELTSNISFVLAVAPTQFSLGATKYAGVSVDPTSVNIMQHAGSAQTTKLFADGVLGGKFAEKPIVDVGRKSAIGKSEFGNSLTIAKDNILKYSGAKVFNQGVEKLAELLISSPDKAIARPLWFGVFADNFKNGTGKDIDFEKMRNGDEKYLRDNKAAIERARLAADELSVMAGATNNPFSSVIKLQEKKGQKGWENVYRLLSGYFQTFLNFEYATAKTGVINLMGNGHLTRRQGAAIMAGVSMRMSIYGTMYAFLSDALAEAFGFEGEDDDEEDWVNMLKNDFMGSMLTLVLGRNLTSFPKIPINMAIEHTNKMIIEANGGVHGFNDTLVFSQLGPHDFDYGDTIYDFLGKLYGPFGPPVKGGNEVWKKLVLYKRATTEKKREAIFGDIIKESGFQLAGQTGFIPLFKDFNKIWKKEAYRESQRSKRNKGRKKKSELQLGGFDNNFGNDLGFSL